MTHYIHLKIAKILSLLPLENKYKSYHKAHGILIIVCLLAMFAGNIYYRIYYYYRYIKNIRKLLDAMIHTFTTLTNVNSILVAAFFHHKYWILLLKKNKTPLLVTTCFSNTFFYILDFLFIFYTFCEINYYRKINTRIITYLIPSYINIFIILMSILNINYYANELKNMLSTFRLNLKSEKIKLDEIIEKETNPYIVSKKFASESRTDDHFKYFVDICYKMDAFNKIYGWQILNFAAVLLIFAYDSLSTVLREFFREDPSQMHIQLLLIKMLKCFNFLIFGLLLIKPCFAFNGQMDKVVVLCRKILINLPETCDNGFCRYLKLKLVFLLKQIEMKKPYFSAAGFFEVDYVMLVYILNGITSYLMVTLQAAY